MPNRSSQVTGTPARPLRIAFVNTSLDIGGIERQMLALAEGLPRDRFTVEFVLLRKAGTHAPAARALGVTVHVLGFERLGEGHLALLPLRLLRRVRHIAQFVALVRRRRYDVLDAWQYQSYVLCGLTRPLTRVPVLVVGRRTLSESAPRSGRPWPLIARLATRAADAVVANAEAVRQDVARRERLNPSRIRVIRNGVEPAERSPARRAAARARWGVEDGDLVVGCVANFRPEKALERLVRVAEAVSPSAPTVRFVVVGDGPARESLAHFVAARGLSDRVILHGHEPDARALLDGMDIVVHPSDAEGLPNAVLEAAAAGLPIVATDVGGIREILEDRRSGLIVRPRDERALADGLTELIRSPELRATFGQRARRHVRAAFPMDRMVAGVATLYGELAATTES